MDFESLRTFCVLYETGSFTKAAERIGITEATVSYRIKELEKYVGRELVIRKRDRTLAFTEKSREFYDRVRETISWLDDFRNISKPKELSGTLRVSAGEVAGISFVASAANGFKEKYSSVDIRLDFCSAVESLKKLQGRESDIGFLASINFRAFRDFLNSVKVTPIIPIQLGLIAATGHPLLKKKSISPSDMIGYPFVGRHENSALQAEIEKIFEKAGMSIDRLNVAYRFQNTSSVIGAVAEGLGISISSETHASKYVKAGLIGFVPLRTDVKSYLYMIDRHNEENEVVNAFQSYIKEYLRLREVMPKKDSLPS
ncbi:MAG: LysR family transcriptional regulator [Thermoplasmataceae archaeon]